MTKTEKILSFSPYAYWRIHALYEVALCHNLQWRGHSYNYVSCDGLFSDCDLFWESTTGPRRANTCAVCQSQVKSLLEGSRIPNTWLGKYKVPGDDLVARSFEQNLKDPELLEAVFNGYPVGAWVKSSVHTHLRINSVDLLNPKHCATLRSYIYSGVIAITTINRMLDALQPTILLLFNGRMSVPRIALELAKARGIRVVCHERGVAKETLRLWENESCLALRPYARLWQEWGEVPLSRSEVTKVTQWLVDRAHGTNLNWRAFSVQSSLGVVGNFLDANQGRKVWSLFTSSTDEIVAEPEYRSAFVTQYRWIEETVAFARLTPAIALVIRVHPNSGGKKSNGRNQEELEFFRRLQATLPANVALVMPDDEVSTYALIDRSDLGLVYGSTVALEMACRGKKVLLGARTAWMSCGSIELLTEPQNYASILAAHAATRPDTAAAEKIAIAAYRFAYAYVQRLNIPFPLVRMPNVYSGVLTARTLGELKPGVHDCLDYCAEIVLGLRPAVPVASAPVRPGAQREELEAVRVGLKTLAGEPAEAPGIRASVVLACYNHGKYLRDCVRSVGSQTFRHLELIIVNDGSTDDSAAVAEACLKEFPRLRITLINQPHSGQPALARNAGIMRAQGEFILPLDASDQIDARYLEEAFDVIDADPGVDLVYSDSLFDNGKARSRKKPGRFEVKSLAAANQLVYCCVYRRKIWEKIGGYRDNVYGYEDWDFWLATSLIGATAAYIPRVGLLCNEKDNGVYSQPIAHHQAGAAQVMLNNPAAYSSAQLQRARALLDPSNNQKPPVLVSVVIPCYNQSQYLAEAVESVRSQTYRNWEIIIVNDGSPDDTSEVARHLILSHRDSRIRLIEKPNGGLADARNAGIRFAQGEYVLPLDADNIIDPAFLAKTTALLEADPKVGIAYTDWAYFGAHQAKRDALEYDFRRLCTKGNLFACTSLYRRQAWEATGGYNPNMTRGEEDWDFWISCGEQGFKGQRIPEPLFYCRAEEVDMSHALRPHLPAMFARVILNHPKLYGPDVVRRAESIFSSANLPPAKASSAGVEWSPPAISAGDIGQIVTEAEKLVRDGRREAAIAKIEQTLPLAPNAECAARTNEILELLRGARSEAGAPAESQAATAAGDLFGADEVQNIRQLIATYENNPNDPLREQLVDFQQHLMSFLVTADRDALEVQFRGSLGEVFRALVQSGLSAASPADETAGQLDVLDESLRKPAQLEAVFDFRPLLARMLLAPAHRGSMVMVVDKIPTWLLGDYLGYVQRVPRTFGIHGEAGEYCAHMLRWVRGIVERIRTAPGEAQTLKLASFFAAEANYGPLGFSGSNALELAEKRAAILEFVLAQNGAVIDARLSETAPAQVENQGWLQMRSREAV